MKTLFILTLAAFYAASGQSQTTKVYTSQSGKKYHTHADCQYIKGRNNVKTITLSQAKTDGKELCSRCEYKDKKGAKK